MSEWSSVEAGPDTIWHKHTTHNINYPVGRLPTIDCRITHEKPLIQTEKIKRANAFDTQSDELQRQFMKALESGAFGQDQAHSLAVVIFG
jgi:hypothetical protein